MVVIVAAMAVVGMQFAAVIGDWGRNDRGVVKWES